MAGNLLFLVPNLKLLVNMLNFICGGLLGDFIQCLFAVKHLCQTHQVKANLYVTDNLWFGGDKFKYTIDKVFADLAPVVLQQEYINNFDIFNNQTNELINLNKFRQSPLLYHNNWTEFLQHTFNFTFTPPYQWVTIKETNQIFNDKILIHRSLKRHKPDFPFQQIINKYQNQLMFISHDINEYNAFPFKDQIQYYQTANLIEMYAAINSCKFFIGNQSSPYTLASSIDKLRVLELAETPDKYSSLGEDKYTTQIMDVAKIL